MNLEGILKVLNKDYEQRIGEAESKIEQERKKAEWKIAKMQSNSFRNILLIFLALAIIFLVFLSIWNNHIILKWMVAFIWGSICILPFSIISKVKERKAFKKLIANI